MTVLLSSTSFEETSIVTLGVDGRPAWPLHQVATAVRAEPVRLLARITTEWSSAFVPQRDYAVLVGDDLDAVRQFAPDLLATDAKGLPILFESGLLVLIAKLDLNHRGLSLRQHLVEQLPAPTEPRVTTELDLRVARERRLAGVLEFHDRRFRYGALRTTAIELHAGGFVNSQTYRALIVRACEIALGAPLTDLGPSDDWSTVAQIAERTGASEGVVLSTATALKLIEGGPEQVRAFPVHQKRGWRVSFAFAPPAAAQLETVVANRVADRATLLKAA
jgi:hypothetical protein